MGCDFNSKSPKNGQFWADEIESLELNLEIFQNVELDAISENGQIRKNLTF